MKFDADPDLFLMCQVLRCPLTDELAVMGWVLPETDYLSENTNRLNHYSVFALVA